MSINIELRGQIEAMFQEAENLLRSLPNGAIEAGSRALNRAIIAGRTAALKKAKQRYYIKSDALRKGMKIKKATKSYLLAKMSSKSTRQELINFQVNPKTVIRGKKSMQLTVAVKRGGALRTIPRAFIEKGKNSGRIHLLQRATNSRYPTPVKYGPSATEMLGHDDVIPYVEEKAGQTLLKRLDHEINYMLGR